MELGALLSIAIILLTGLIFGKLASFVRLPNVTGYLVGGLVIGPSILNVISEESIGSLGIVSQVALGFIALTIGLSFKFSYFKRVGWTPVVIALFEATLAVIVVQVALMLAGFDIGLSIMLGAIAAATAPAATVMVIKQYKAKGPVTDTLLSVVAIDDAIAIILFGFSAAFVQTLGDSSTGVAAGLLTFLSPLIEILGAFLIGSLVAVVMKYALEYFTTRGARLSLLISGVFLITGLAGQFGVSELLANMAGGMVLTNISLQAQRLDEMTDYITPPIYMAFFVISGARLQIGIIPTIGLIGIIYIVFRVIGKVSGAYIGAKVMKAPPKIQKYLGPMLIPQAGVAIGLTTVAEQLIPQHAAEITAVVLVGTLVYEFIGPVITKISLEKAGEIKAQTQ